MLATSFNECNVPKSFTGRQCLNITSTGICKTCPKVFGNYSTAHISVQLLYSNIVVNNYPMVKLCLKMWSFSSFEIMRCFYAINTRTYQSIMDLLYFNTCYYQGPLIMGKSIYNMLSPKTLSFICEKIFIIDCLLDCFDDKGLFDLKRRLISTKIDEHHLDMLHDKMID